MPDACGFIICRDPISDHVPVSTADDPDFKGTKTNCTQYDGHVIESTGLIKMDFLGLKTLSELKEACANIKRTRGIDVDLDTIPIDDPKTYELYQKGQTIGTFQFESAGMQKYLRELHPTVFEDLIAMNALYRPGPMDYIPSFIARKNGREEIKYDIDCMEKYLKDTYGITVYQEQVMLLSRQLADFTRGESDALRKAMGKKKKDIVDAMKPKFIDGGVKNGHDPKVLEKIWADWEKFASYAFNKSHAACYSWVAYQTAYLKANYPAEFMAAIMSRRRDQITEITKLMDECKSMGIATLRSSLSVRRTVPIRPSSTSPSASTCRMSTRRPSSHSPSAAASTVSASRVRVISPRTIRARRSWICSCATVSCTRRRRHRHRTRSSAASTISRSPHLSCQRTISAGATLNA